MKFVYFWEYFVVLEEMEHAVWLLSFMITIVGLLVAFNY